MGGDPEQLSQSMKAEIKAHGHKSSYEQSDLDQYGDLGS